MKQGFFISKKEHKRNLKKPHKWQVQAICGEEKSQPPKGISIKMFKKKTGGKRVNCFLYIVHRAPEKMSKMFAKKVSKEGAKGHHAIIKTQYLCGLQTNLFSDWQQNGNILRLFKR